jgi:hypothetical protein
MSRDGPVWDRGMDHVNGAVSQSMVRGMLPAFHVWCLEVLFYRC